MVKLFTRTAAPIHSGPDYDSFLPPGDPALVNQPDYVEARTREYIDWVLIQALTSPDWTFEPVTGDVIAPFLRSCPKWKAEGPNYFPAVKAKILKAIWVALREVQDQMNAGVLEDNVVVKVSAERRIKKHVVFQGFDIGIEYQEGDVRSGTAPSGFKWEREVVGRYGRFKDLLDSADGEALDVWLGDDETTDHVFVVNQLREDGGFDEHKILMGFPTVHAALVGYLSNMPDDWTRFDPLKTLTLAEFRRWVQTGDGQSKVATGTFDGYCPICGGAGCRGECASSGRKQAGGQHVNNVCPECGDRITCKCASFVHAALPETHEVCAQCQGKKTAAGPEPWPVMWVNREGVPHEPNAEQEEDSTLLIMVHDEGRVDLRWRKHLSAPQLSTAQYFLEFDPRWHAEELSWSGSGIQGAMDVEEFLDLNHPADIYDAHTPPATKMAAEPASVPDELHDFTPTDLKVLVDNAAKVHPVQAVDPTRTPEFQAWFGQSVVKDGQGHPRKVYHGTTHEFDRFKAVGNTEGYYGPAMYFTSSTRDVSQHYAKPDGPDITSRIERRAEDILNDIQYSDEWDGVLPDWGTSDYKKLEAIAHEKARKEIAGQHEGAVYVTYLRIEHPVYVKPGGGTIFQIMNENTGGTTGMGNRLYKAVLRACSEISNGYDTAKLGQRVWECITSEGEGAVTAYEMEEGVRQCDDLYDYEGGPGPVVTRIYQLLGFDGIIQDAASQFKGMGLEAGDTHYIIWNPRQVKSAIGNSGAFNRRSPRLVASVEFDLHDGQQRTLHVKLTGKTGPDFDLYINPQSDGDLEGELHVTTKAGEVNHGSKPFLPHAVFDQSQLVTAQRFVDAVWACVVQEYREVIDGLMQAGDKAGAQAVGREAQGKRQEILADIVGHLVDIPKPKYRPGIQARTRAKLFTVIARWSDDRLLKIPGMTPELLAEATKVDNDRYLEWVCRQAVAGTCQLPADTEKLKQGLRIFSILKKDPAYTGAKDIRKYEPSDLMNFVRATPDAKHSGLIDKLIKDAPTFDDLYEHLETTLKPTELRDLLHALGGVPRLRKKWDDVHGEADDLAFSMETHRISPRKPTSLKGEGEDPNGPIKLQPEIAAWAKKPKAMERAVEVFQSYPGFGHIKKRGTAKNKMKYILDQLVGNLVWLYNQVPAQQRERSKMWYTGGNRLIMRWAKRFGIDPHKIAGVIAVLSPQRDWFQNISLAERVLDTYLFHQDDVWDESMTKAVEEWVEKANIDKEKVRQAYLRKLERQKAEAEAKGKGKKKKTPAKAAAEDPEPEVEDDELEEGGENPEEVYEDPNLMLKWIPLCEGKTLAQVSTEPDLCALWIRAYDQAHPDKRNYRIVSPEGEFGDWSRKTDMSKGVCTWGSLAFVWKAVDVINSPSIEHISDMIGENHKVRSFYNNLIAPYSPGGDVTIDTHAVAAALIRPLAGSSREVNNNFGTTKTGDTEVKPTKDAVGGNQGTYAVYADAYRIAAKQVGVSPREMQSITWEAVRTLFKAHQKNDKILRQTIAKSWENVSRGTSDAETARNAIRDAAKGFEAPSWAGPHYQPDDYSRHSSYQTELPLDSGPGPGPGEPGRGAGSVTSSRAAGARGARPALFTRRARFLTESEVRRRAAAEDEIGSGAYAATTHGKFWGHAGAGVVFVAQDTGRVLVAYRSAFVNEPHTWGVWGGAFEHGEAPEHAAAREAREETGYTGRMSLEQAFVFKKGDFTYTTFLAHVPEEFTPHLDWETEGWRWVEPGDWPTPIHYGLKAAIPGILAKLGPDREPPPEGTKKARLFIKERPHIKGDILVTVDVAKVEANISRDPNMYVGPGGTGAVIGDRYPRFQQWLADNPEIPVKVSDLGWNPVTQMVVFGNGRHRWAVLRDQGATRIAVTVPSYDLGVFQKLFDAKVVEGGQHVAAERRSLAEAIKRVYKANALYVALTGVQGHSVGPFDGGCLICAKALILAAGTGTLVRIVRAEGGADGPDQTEHYGAKIDGIIYDFAGGFTSAAAWVNHFAKVEAMCTGYDGEPIKLYVAEGLQLNYRPALDPPDDPEKSKVIAALLVKAMGGKTASIDVHKAWARMVQDRGPEFAADITERAQHLIDHANGRIAKDQPKGYEEETERINARSKTPEAQRAHKFEAATWTFPNGHPRCRICGDEEMIDGMCPGRKTAKVASMGDITREEWNQMTYEGSTRDSIRRNLPDYGFNVNDDEHPWTQMILKGQKTVETRNSPSLSAHVGETVAIIRTRKGQQAAVVGTCVLGQPKVYRDNAAFRADQQAHQVPAGGGYDIPSGAVKYGYPVTQVKACAPFPITAQGRVWRRLTTV